MNKLGKILISQALAGTLLLTCAATACNPGGGGYQEEGTVVTFDYNMDKVRDLQIVLDEGETTVEKPADPIREGYTFSHWQTAENGGDRVDFPYTATENVTLYACWDVRSYAVTFDMNVDGLQDVVKNVPYESTVSALTEAEMPAHPDGTPFFAWKNQPSEDATDIQFPYTVLGDTTFYAIWGEGYTIDFDLNLPEGVTADLTTPNPIRILAGRTILATAFASPTMVGWDFEGWALEPDSDDTISLRRGYTPTSSHTLYAVWERQTYTAQFRYNYVGRPSVTYGEVTRGLFYGDILEGPMSGGELLTEDPVREGYTFDGWWTQAQGGTKIEFPVTVSSSGIYYAHWIAPAFETDTFHAEFTFINPNELYPGYSGSAQGCGIINAQATGDVGIVHNGNEYETNEAYPNNRGHFVTYLYKQGATLTFEIYASQAISGATLSANLAYEFAPVGTTIAPTGDTAWKVIVNDVELNYGSITFTESMISGINRSAFTWFTLGNVDLNEGKNVIQLVTANSNPLGGGTMAAFAPIVDCIRFSNYSGTLYYHPLYDNLWYGSLGA